MNPNDLGTEQTIDQDRLYRGSRFADVWDATRANPYQNPWGGAGQPALPVYPVSLGLFLTGLLPFSGPLRIRQATQRTVDSHADLRFGVDGTGFRRLLHPNGVCLGGEWEITEQTPYSGYFSRGSRALLVGRYSTCCTETRRGHTRSLSLVGKLFPTRDPHHREPLRTASFFTQQDLGGDNVEYANDAEFRNAPDTRLWRRGAGWPILAISGLVFMRVDREPAIRQLYEIAELGKPEGEPTRCPKFMRLLMDPAQPRIPGEELDIRDEILAQIYDRGNPAPQRRLVFLIEVTDEGTRSGAAAFQTCQFRNWRRIGKITFTEAVASLNGDRVIHFHHPTWRADRNDPSTATRRNEQKVGSAPAQPAPPQASYPTTMIALRILLVALGLALALTAAFVSLAVLPWLVGGSGIAVGLLSVGTRLARPAFLGSLGLVVALSAIHLQTFNPMWLASIVFFMRVFFAHVLLVVALGRFLSPKQSWGD